jgi:sulfoxide reductase heme-binding subunit YedZ
LSGDLLLWELIRASGLIAYALLSLAVILGVGVRARAFDWLAKRAWVFEFHQVISVLALAFTALHALLLLGNAHVPFGLMEILVPFTSRWRTGATASGTVALYLLAALVITSYMRARIGEQVWRSVHYSGFLAWGIALFHGVFAGNDSSTVWVQYLYVGTGALVALLTVFRILETTFATSPPDPPRRNRPSKRAPKLGSQEPRDQETVSARERYASSS